MRNRREDEILTTKHALLHRFDGDSELVSLSESARRPDEKQRLARDYLARQMMQAFCIVEDAELNPPFLQPAPDRAAHRFADMDVDERQRRTRRDQQLHAQDQA